jgi:hypothetical protein
MSRKRSMKTEMLLALWMGQMSVNDPSVCFVDAPISQLREEATKLNFYHSLELGDGWETVGDFDIRPQIYRYGFPESMQDMTVLDVGQGSGYFSFEFERRGAKVCNRASRSTLQRPRWVRVRSRSPSSKIQAF